jgi:TolB-like protein
MPALLLAVLLSAAGPAKQKVVVLDLAASDKPVQTLASTLTEQILTELSATNRLEVMGRSDMAAILGLERQKQLLGCSDDSSTCLAEIGGALGAPYLVSGMVAQVGTKIRLDLKLIQTNESKVLARQGQVVGSPEEALTATTAMLKELVKAIPGVPATLPRDAPVVVRTEPRVKEENTFGTLTPKIMIGVGAAFVIAGALAIVLQSFEVATLETGINTTHINDALAAKTRIQGIRGAGVAGIALGVLVGGAGGIWYGISKKMASSSAPAPTVAFDPETGAAHFGLAGAW